MISSKDINNLKNSRKKGFTLIELLIVVAIIGILAGIVTVSLGDPTGAANDVTDIANLKQLPTIYIAEQVKIKKKPIDFCGNEEVVKVMNAVFGKEYANAEKDEKIYYRSDSSKTFGANSGCHSNGFKWVAWKILSNDSDPNDNKFEYYCVDWKNNTKIVKWTGPAISTTLTYDCNDSRVVVKKIL